jgi:hypothetical protein
MTATSSSATLPTTQEAETTEQVETKPVLTPGQIQEIIRNSLFVRKVKKSTAKAVPKPKAKKSKAKAKK